LYQRAVLLSVRLSPAAPHSAYQLLMVFGLQEQKS